MRSVYSSAECTVLQDVEGCVIAWEMQVENGKAQAANFPRGVVGVSEVCRIKVLVCTGRSDFMIYCSYL